MTSLRLSCSGQHGYSLLEVLVAFAILALAVATILSLFATGLRNTAVAADYARALTLAESQLASVQVKEAAQLDVGVSEGIEAGLHWQVRVSPYDELASSVQRAHLYRIEVRVDWGEEERRRAVQLSTLRIGKAP